MTNSNKLSACIKAGCGKPFDPAEPEARDNGKPKGFTILKAFWFRYCPEHRLLAEPQEVIVNRPADESEDDN